MSSTHKHRRCQTMPFGRHRGTKISDLPDHYIEWLLSIELREPLRSAVSNEYRQRMCTDDDSSAPAVNTLIVDEIVGAGVRALSKKFHPDVGGDHQKMVAINRTAEWIRTQGRRISE
jgi:hypothetical protein